MQIYKPQKQIGVAVIDSGVAMDHPEISLRLGGKVLEQNGVTGVDDDEKRICRRYHRLGLRRLG
jgi:hypothetical protein